jgi:hypothetical protein
MKRRALWWILFAMVVACEEGGYQNGPKPGPSPEPGPNDGEAQCVLSAIAGVVGSSGLSKKLPSDIAATFGRAAYQCQAADESVEAAARMVFP